MPIPKEWAAEKLRIPLATDSANALSSQSQSSTSSTFAAPASKVANFDNAIEEKLKTINEKLNEFVAEQKSMSDFHEWLSTTYNVTDREMAKTIEEALTYNALSGVDNASKR